MCYIDAAIFIVEKIHISFTYQRDKFEIMRLSVHMDCFYLIVDPSRQQMGQARSSQEQAYLQVLNRFGNAFTLSEILNATDVNYQDEDLTGGLFGRPGHLPALLTVAKSGDTGITTGDMPFGLFPRPNGVSRTGLDFYPTRSFDLDPESQPDLIVLHR